MNTILPTRLDRILAVILGVVSIPALVMGYMAMVVTSHPVGYPSYSDRPAFSAVAHVSSES